MGSSQGFRGYFDFNRYGETVSDLDYENSAIADFVHRSKEIYHWLFQLEVRQGRFFAGTVLAPQLQHLDHPWRWLKLGRALPNIQILDPAEVQELNQLN
jgi:hypothetical protein